MTTSPEKCATCYGEGTVGGRSGPEACPDCGGLGRLPSATVLLERRLRELERAPHDGSLGEDIAWLVAEVRRSQHALMQILAAAQDGPDDDPICKTIRGLSNHVLGVYGPGDDSPDSK